MAQVHREFGALGESRLPPSTSDPTIRRPRRGLNPAAPVVLSGLIGTVAILAAGLGGYADLDAAVLVAAVAFGASLLLALGSLSVRTVVDQARQDAPPDRADEPGLPFATLVEALPDPLMVISALEPDDLIGRRYVFANAAARELLKIQADSGLLVTALRDPDVLEVIDEALFGSVSGETVYNFGGAQERVFRAMARPLSQAADGSRMALIVFREETESRRVERTRVDFLANASHELRTPLASLSGFIETLRGHAREDVGARDRFLQIMQTQADRMSRLIDDLMSLSRIELNEHIAPGGEVDLHNAVLDVLDAVGPIAKGRKVRIEVEGPGPGAARVVGDRDQIIQVVQNLVDNALKYSPDGGVMRVELAADLSAEAAAAGRRPNAARLSLLTPDHGIGRFAVLRVSDSGVGIAREHLPRLTERFYRVEGQKSGDRLGTGLGLAIVKHIVNRHRGGMAVESAEGEGTTFAVYFPCAPEVQSSSAPAGTAVVMKPS